MTVMISEVYRAFRSAGVSEEEARSAAEALSQEQLATKADILRIEKDLMLLKWMVGFIAVAVVIPLFRGAVGM